METSTKGGNMNKNVLKKLMALTLSTVMVLGAAVTANAAETGSGVSTARIYGDTRFTTATKVADTLKTELGLKHFENIVVANSDAFADALSATALAVQKKAPILVVNKNNEGVIRDYISRNLVTDGTVYIIGGTAAVTERFENSLTDCKVERLGGSDRYETNMLVLEKLNMGNRVMVASGLKYPDALSSSATGYPIILTGTSLTDAQKDFLNDLGSKTYYIIGGPAAVNGTVAAEFKGAKRLQGDTRYDTGLEIAKEFFGSANGVFIASGDAFPDGLTGGVLANAAKSPLLLVNEKNTSHAAGYVKSAGVKNITAIGGTAAISNTALNAVVGIEVEEPAKGDVPTGVKITHFGGHRFTIDWNDVKEADGYQLRTRSEENPKWSYISKYELYPTDIDTYKDTQYPTDSEVYWWLGLEPTWHEVQVRSYDTVGGKKVFSDWSDTARIEAQNTAASIQKAAVEYMESKNPDYRCYINEDHETCNIENVKNGTLTPTSSNAAYPITMARYPYDQYESLDRLYDALDSTYDFAFGDSDYPVGYLYIEDKGNGEFSMWWLY